MGHWVWAVGAGAIGLPVGCLLSWLMDWLPTETWPPPSPFRYFLCWRLLSIHQKLPLVGTLAHRPGCTTPMRLPGRAPVVVALTPLAFALTTWHLGAAPSTLVTLAYLAILAVAVVCDLEHTLIPNRLVYPTIPLALALAPLGPFGSSSFETGAYVNALTGAGSALGIFLVIYLVARGRLGAGDVKLASLIGVMLGFPMALVALGTAFVGGGVGALVMMILRRKGLRDTLPYAPFLGGGAVLTIFQGETIRDSYLALLRIGGF